MAKMKSLVVALVTVAAFATNLTNTRMVNTDVITFSYPELTLIEPREVGVSRRGSRR